MDSESVERDRRTRLLGKMLEGAPAGGTLDWESLVRHAREERLAPLLYWKLRNDPGVPHASRVELRQELYRSEGSNLALYRALSHLLQQGEKRGLAPPVLLKGAALATSVYDEIGLRPMSDADVLVRRESASAWLDCARELSFHRLSPEMAPGLTDAVHYQVALEGGPTGDALIEIHFGLIAGASDWRAPDVSWFFERTEPWTPHSMLAEGSALQLQPTAHLLYLAAHAMLQHGGAQARAIWLYDIHLLLTRQTSRILWEELARKARELRWDAALALALSRSKDLFGTSLPDGYAEELERGASESSRRHVVRRTRPSQTRAELVLEDLAAVGGRDRLRWGFAILFPRPEYMRWRYPRAGRLWPLWYPYRLAVAVREGMRALLTNRSII